MGELPGSEYVPPEKSPVPTRTVMMAFPDTSLIVSNEDKFLVMVTIDTSGVVMRAELLQSSKLLERLALEAARQWRFSPAERRGNPEPVNYAIPIWFETNGE